MSFDKYFWGHVNLEGKVILDVGAGKGATTMKVLEKMSSQGAEGMIIAIDVDSDSLMFAKGKVARTQRVGIVEFITADASHMPLRDESIDLIVSSRALADMNSPPCHLVKVLAELYRVLKGRGRVILSDECPIIKPAKEEELAFLRWKLAKAISHIIGREHAHEVDPNDLEFIMKLIGFKRIRWKIFKGELLTSERMESFIKISMDLISRIDDPKMREAFLHNLKQLWEAFKEKEGFLPPRYILHAQK